MLARLLALWENIRSSLWALPLAVASLCAGLAVLALNLDLPWVSEVGWLYSGTASQAPAFASSLVSAMITLTALAFSITMVVLTLAAQQLGPRLILIFMSDRLTQLSLGLFIGTVIYLLLLLRALDGQTSGQAPNLAITGGTALVLASVIGLLLFVHSLARSIVADHVVAKVGGALDEAIERAFPEHQADEARAPDGGAVVDFAARGYVQRIDYPALVRAARKHSAQIVLALRAGEHVLNGEAKARVVGTQTDLTHDVRRAFLFAQERSGGQDPEWSARQLVEIGLRALSPGINDEFTAIAVINRLSAALSMLAPRAEAPRVWRDAQGAARVFGPAPTFELMLTAAFDQLCAAAAGKQAILACIADNLSDLVPLTSPPRHTAIARQLELLEAIAVRSLCETVELPDVLGRIRRGDDALVRTSGPAHAAT